MACTSFGRCSFGQENNLELPPLCSGNRRGNFILICNSGKSADFPELPLHGRGRYGQRHFRSKRLFTVGVAAANSICLTGCGLQPKRRLAAANAINRNDSTCEKSVPAGPQPCRNCKLKIIFPLFMPRVKRRAFQMVSLPGSPQSSTRGFIRGRKSSVAK